MKDKLEPNMYVRTKKGKIYKFDTNNSMAKNGAKKYMVNCSYNIIDLIEVGDVITTNNLCGEITKIDIENNKIWIACCDYETCSAEDIKSVVTHEQMEQMAYKVGE